MAAKKNSITDAMVVRGCPDKAKRIYLDVIDTYVGSGYEAARQHAMVGIEDARDAEHRKDPLARL